MPEGDTIHRTARTLRAVLVGRGIVAARAPAPGVRAVGAARLVGRTVDAVEARGKHLLVWFAPRDLALHTHMMMSGSWHTYRQGERWRKPARLARAVLETADSVAVCFSAPVCALLSRAEIDRHPQLAALGPDAVDPDADLEEAHRRLDARGAQEVGVALGDQHVLAGVGNVFRCEVLFVEGIDPWARVSDLSPGERERLLARAAQLLRLNAGPQAGPRVTTGRSARGGARLHVYGRAGRPCPRCAAPIRAARQGPHARVTYWCPRCQCGGRAGATC